MKPVVLLSALVFLGWPASATQAGQADIDQTGFDPACGVTVAAEGSLLIANWSTTEGATATLRLNLTPGEPFLHSLELRAESDAKPATLLERANPVVLLTVGRRDLSKQDGWVVFFDSPYTRPHETFRAKLDPRSVEVSSQARRATIKVSELTAGPFRGTFWITLYPGTDLLRLEAVVATKQDASAIVYDLGLTTAAVPRGQIAYFDNHDALVHEPLDMPRQAASIAVRNRAIAIDTRGGSFALFPPPHQFLYPLDSADNFRYVWRGQGWRDRVPQWGIGICQPREGDQRHVPWINAPPGTAQHLSAFCLLRRGTAEECLARVRRYTRDDRFKKLPGHVTFTSHYHIEHTLDYLARQKQQDTDTIPAGLEKPGFVEAFQSRGLEIVHLAEFHVARSPDFYAHRLPHLQLLHRECRRLSNDRFLLLPGEEPNAHLGGHWLSLFPRPVYWTFRREPREPFVEDREPYGKVYRVGSAAEVLRLMEAEQGLMWTAHPRIKSSLGFPDGYREREFFASDRFLGAAWKAMPADLSSPRLGSRSLDLLDDMANWGQRKYVLGEVDVFRVQPEFELYGHMNANYLRLDRLPRYEDGWGAVLDALRAGKFFVTTGEVLIPAFTVGGKSSGETLRLAADRLASLEVRLEWTYPLAYLDIVSGDGIHVAHQRIDLTHCGEFGSMTQRIPINLTGRKWVRVEVWDIAANGAFTQPVWLE